MRVLVLGSGGREHALGWKIAQSPLLQALYFSPGNPGTAELGTNIRLNDPTAIIAFAKSEKIDLVVVGPEQPLVDGICDRLNEAGISCFGPSQAAAQLEGSKSFAKSVMDAAGVRTAAYRVFDQFDAAWRYVQTANHPLVVKADGLAAGKGVTICKNPDDTLIALQEALQQAKFGTAGNQVVIEEFLQGHEASFHLICDGERVVPLISAQDHKTLYEGNLGPNTGGMGTFAPTPFLTSEMADDLKEKVCIPVLKEMKRRGAPFKGTLFAGLMLTEKGPYVLEFNCRFGDPETQVIMTLLDGDLLPLLKGAAEGQIPTENLKWKDGAAVCVVMAAAGYPAAPRKGDPIVDLPKGDAFQVFQAGTRRDESRVLLTNGGRVLGITAHGVDIPAARDCAYQQVANIHFKDAQFRGDIGAISNH